MQTSLNVSNQAGSNLLHLEESDYITKAKVSIYHDFLIWMAASNGWAFYWVNNSTIQTFFHSLNSKFKLSDWKQLLSSILDHALNKIDKILFIINRQ